MDSKTIFSSHSISGFSAVGQMMDTNTEAEEYKDYILIFF